MLPVPTAHDLYVMVPALIALMAIASWILTIPIRAFALRAGVVAQPNFRSSHKEATPLGGGLAFVVPVTVAWFVLGITGGDFVLVVTAVVGLLVAWMGFIDDQHRISPKLRLSVQAIAAMIVASLVLWRARGDQSLEYAWLVVGATLLLTWSANLFNFMDGLDGLATTESLFVGIGGLVIAWSTGASAPFVLALAAFVGAIGGFLPWNAPNARIFMGDAGSTWLGFTLGALAIQDSVRQPGLLSAWLILPSLFVADATVCVVRRALRRENVLAGHRAHAYQNLSRKLGSHGAVVLIFVGANACIAPAAWMTISNPESRWVVCGAVYLVVCGVMVAARSGVHGIADPERRRALGFRA